MIYRPNFCCSCGEKIERTEWKLWTSSRFCQLCETDHKLSEFIVKAGVIISILAGIVGVGSYLRQPQAIADIQVTRRNPAVLKGSETVRNANIYATQETPQQSQPQPANNSSVTRANNRETSATSTDQLAAKLPIEPVYYCGAMTKKGTSCSRRVKQRGERCWQHSGMPAFTTSEGVKTSR